MPGGSSEDGLVEREWTEVLPPLILSLASVSAGRLSSCCLQCSTRRRCHGVTASRGGAEAAGRR